MNRLGPMQEWLPPGQQVPWKQFLQVFPTHWAMRMIRAGQLLAHNNPKR